MHAEGDCKNEQSRQLIGAIEKWNAELFRSATGGSSMKYSTDKDVNKVVRELTRNGWGCRKGRHGPLTSPAGAQVTLSLSPSDRNAIRNFKRDVQRLLQSTGGTAGPQHVGTD